MKNKDIVIRKAKLEDASATLKIQKEVIAEGEFLMTVSEEFQNTPEQQRNWIKEKLQNDRETLLVAEVEKEIIGWIVFRSPGRIRLLHTGSIGMMVKKEFRGMGIGKLLMQGY